MAGCGVIPPVDGFPSALIGFFDCQALTLGSQGYQALAAPGSSVAVLLTAMLTVLVAFAGYRMLFGETPSLREAVLTFVKIGIVLALAGNWPAYRTIVFDVVLRAPADLASEIGAPAGIPGASGGLVARLDGTDHAFRTLAIYGVGPPPSDASTGQLLPSRVPPPPFAGFDTFALGAARILFLVGAVGAFALVRLAAGLLLALGPLFLAFLLFDGTRGLFEGWARALVGAALAAFALAITLGVELALFEPWLADLIARRAADQSIAGAPTTLLVTAGVFALAITGVLAMSARLASAIRLPHRTAAPVGFASDARRTDSLLGLPTSQPTLVPALSRSRASAIADAVTASQRREASVVGGALLAGATTNSVAPASHGGAGTSHGATPLGQSYRRRTTGRVSASASARDRSA